jgi:hypothetical protein
MQAAAAGLEGREPDRLQHRQQRLGGIRLGPAHQPCGGAGRRGRRAQGADGGLAMVTQQFDGLVEQFVFVFRPRHGVVPPPLGQDLGFRFGAQVGVHLG